MLVVVIFKELDQFWQIGSVGADREVKSGIDYAAALGMCKHSFSFLGIGAAKLTQNQKAFRDAIDRCNRAEPVRLLLSRPDAPELERFARMAGRDEESYQSTVRESLRFIASLRNKEEKNISVRFYQHFPAFRLMFIDGTICLMSYYIMGKGDGSNLPQFAHDQDPRLTGHRSFVFWVHRILRKNLERIDGLGFTGVFVTVGSVHGRFSRSTTSIWNTFWRPKDFANTFESASPKHDITSTDSNPLGRHRERPESNPLTFFERIGIISDVLIESGIDRSKFGFVPFPIETPQRLPDFMSVSVPSTRRFVNRGMRKKSSTENPRIQRESAL